MSTLRIGFILALLTVTFGQADSSVRRSSSNLDPIPLAVGNTWTYLKKAPMGGLFCKGAFIDKRGDCFVNLIPNINTPCSSTETYKIVSSPTKGKFEVAIGSSSGSVSGARDGRYVSRVFWEKTDTGKGKAISGAIEEIIGPFTAFPLKNEDGSPIGAGESARPLTFVWRRPARAGSVGGRVTGRFPGGNTFATEDRPVTIRTPAGTFDNCCLFSETIVMDQPSSGSSKKTSTVVLATVQSYYCPGVGLVKEVERNREGKVLYTMTLKSYRVAK